MSIGSEGSPTLSRRREKSKLRRVPSNSISTEDETMPSDQEDGKSSEPFANDSDARRSVIEGQTLKEQPKRPGSHKKHSIDTANLAEAGTKGYQPASSSSSHSSISAEDETSVPRVKYVAKVRATRDYTPNAYDTTSLAFKTGDIIYILKKCQTGMWRGMLNGREGDVKFIMVEDLPEEEDRPARTVSNFHRRSYRRPRPKTVEELLRRLGMLHVLNKFLLHGFDTLELFSTLEESHLDSLQINDAAERTKLLTVASLLVEKCRYLNIPFATTLYEGEQIDSD